MDLSLLTLIFTTERQLAQHKIDEIKVCVEKSQVDYLFVETPFKISIQLRKKFLTDKSPKSIECSSPVSSKTSTLNDSAISSVSSCSTCEKFEKEKNNVHKELEKITTETSKKISLLNNENN